MLTYSLPNFQGGMIAARPGNAAPHITYLLRGQFIAVSHCNGQAGLG